MPHVRSVEVLSFHAANFLLRRKLLRGFFGQSALILILGLCCGITTVRAGELIRIISVWIGFASFVALSLITLFTPPWTDWHWLVPVIALAPFWLLTAWMGLILLAWAVIGWGYE